MISYYRKVIYICTKDQIIKNNIKKTLSGLFIDNVSGNIFWTPIDIKESSGAMYLFFLGITDHKGVKNDYDFKTLNNKLTRNEMLALDIIKHKLSKLQPEVVAHFFNNGFLISELFDLYRTLVDKNKDRANFYKLVKKKDYIVPVGRRKREVYHRPPQYYEIK
ncbi:hypothetical protein JXA63_02590 [Candidatus Woesebacteria bacterium]|nr:hypothetical protein [Candidatus Woesebacteria bacterium]